MTYENTELTPKAFYRNLRIEDRPTVERVVESLHEHGFDVYATGSSLERGGLFGNKDGHNFNCNPFFGIC